jgi:hypothetical protein
MPTCEPGIMPTRAAKQSPPRTPAALPSTLGHHTKADQDLFTKTSVQIFLLPTLSKSTKAIMKFYSFLMLAAAVSSAIAAEPVIEISVSATASKRVLEACICKALISEINGVNNCAFEKRRMEEGEEIEVEEEGDRDLQGGSCANCNPGPSGQWCRWMHCRRRRELQDGISVNSVTLLNVEMDVESCLGPKGGSVQADIVF